MGFDKLFKALADAFDVVEAIMKHLQQVSQRSDPVIDTAFNTTVLSQSFLDV